MGLDLHSPRPLGGLRALGCFADNLHSYYFLCLVKRGLIRLLRVNRHIQAHVKSEVSIDLLPKYERIIIRNTILEYPMKILGPAVFIMSLLASASAFAGSCGGAAHKHSPEEMANHYFDKMDLNGDKAVTKEEFEKAKMEKMVKSFDALKPNDEGIVKRDSFIKLFIKAHSKPKPQA